MTDQLPARGESSGPGRAAPGDLEPDLLPDRGDLEGRPVRVGSLCTGIGGLELALEAAGLTTQLVFVADNDAGPAQVLAERFPHADNLGDWTNAELPDVDLLVGGLPCQPVSHAGRQGGTDDERWLFDDLGDQIGRMGTRPDVYLENVRGMLTANGGHAMARAVSRLAALGYVGRWGCLNASAVGAPHRRNRWFCYATADPDRLRRQRRAASDRQDERLGIERRDHAARRHDAAADTAGIGRDSRPGPGESGPGRVGRPGPDHDDRTAPADSDDVGRQGREPGAPSDAGRRTRDQAGRGPTLVGGTQLALLPTPLANLGDGRGLPAAEHARRRFDEGRRNLDDAVALLPTPTASHVGGTAEQMLARKPSHDGVRTQVTDLRMRLEQLDGTWGQYAPAIARWETIVGRPAPNHLIDGRRLDPLFVEWFMGFPAGWITDLDLARTIKLRMLGNAVVPAQAAAAHELLLTNWP